MMASPKNLGAGNGTVALAFHIARLKRAMPDHKR
jgi:hypothetical protein